jgi:hypothetical protein
MDQHQQLLSAAILLQNKIANDKATRSGHHPSASNPGQESDAQKDLSKSDGVDRESDIASREASSRHHSGTTVTWESENAGLEDEFSALKTILSAYLDLQTRIFHDLGGDEASCRDAESASSEAAHDRGLVLLDAVRYIQYLEELQQNLVDEKSELEDKVTGWEKKGSEDGATT